MKRWKDLTKSSSYIRFVKCCKHFKNIFSSNFEKKFKSVNPLAQRVKFSSGKISGLITLPQGKGDETANFANKNFTTPKIRKKNRLRFKHICKNMSITSDNKIYFLKNYFFASFFSSALAGVATEAGFAAA